VQSTKCSITSSSTGVTPSTCCESDDDDDEKSPAEKLLVTSPEEAAADEPSVLRFSVEVEETAEGREEDLACWWRSFEIATLSRLIGRSNREGR
jgi:hypothetical protein